ncbi:5748_t:CDS:2 [Funneliformis geosporum]|uniref:5748_t:CDS:1 n=1 Tax=Funneliformis geosporum TaxID=1117311 RepID=A0A9W4SGZ3_9GLOM|nr:5748_t:CDS:2 [Funneliformis geosporum]
MHKSQGVFYKIHKVEPVCLEQSLIGWTKIAGIQRKIHKSRGVN